MRKDYVPLPADVEEADVDEHRWTEVWARQADPTAVVDKVMSSEEYAIIRPWLRRLRPGARLLHGGCALGHWTVTLDRLGYRTTGLDISRVTVSRIGKLFPDVQFEAGDVRATGQPAGAFDAYVAWGVFEHVEEGLGVCLRDAFRILKPGGLLFMSVPFDNVRHSLLAQLNRKRKAAPADRPYCFHQWRLTRGELRRELSLGGFEVLDLRPMHARQGALRLVHDQFGLPRNSRLAIRLSGALGRVVPAGFIGHMILGIACKPAGI